ncbi:hypothetical protein BT96DRAFT_945941 [Gymnopus androsaceus JB14]|uniref:Uncharacterized protein n=1 Tax=Gymnopus androsaceus JB14 TaxID=1447944 RepID=A0A6A4GY26_9AGAR|nr:hypothetical protein BT96DRAFT_945941 [Gymnopus androsaceus JB14]
MSDSNPATAIPDDDIDIDAMEAALAAAKDRKEKIQCVREEAARIACKEAKRKAEEVHLAKEEAEKKAEEAPLAKEEAKQKEAERGEAKWKAREDEAEAKARAEEEESARCRQSAEKIADDVIAEMHAAEEKLIVEQKAKDKVADAAKVAEGSWSGAWGGKKKSSKEKGVFPWRLMSARPSQRSVGNAYAGNTNPASSGRQRALHAKVVTMQSHREFRAPDAASLKLNILISTRERFAI